ncbi:MAG TPA: hypothetical protein VG937_04430 [Polyangiaceae bacterium]|nr:hypothetical protein [Polyangiaceae bacterium]
MPRGTFRSVKSLAPWLVAALVGAFFVHAFRRNWGSIQAHPFELRPGYAILSLSAFVFTGLLATYAWHKSVNEISVTKLTFRESIATTNASSMVKYIPGKVWSYALQMYWLSRRGIPKSLVIYVNLINIAVSLLMAAALGGTLLLAVSSASPATTVALLSVLVLLDLLCIKFNARIVDLTLAVASRLLRKEIRRFNVPIHLLVELHIIHMAASVTFALAVYFASFAVGYEITGREALTVMATFLLSEVAAFLTFISPGGLGVRESVMYALLGGSESGSLALLVPLAARMISMVADVVLGGIALRLLKSANGSH